jgi:hypothetical protein
MRRSVEATRECAASPDPSPSLKGGEGRPHPLAMEVRR